MAANETAGTKRLPFLRWRLVVNPRLQWTTVLSFMGCIFAVNAVSGLLLLQFHSRVVRFQILSPERYSEASFSALGIASVFAVTSGVLCALGFGIWCMVLTHRLCGPVFVMHEWVRKAKRGERPAIRPLRGDDAFQAFGVDLADFIRTTSSDADARKSSLSMVLDDLEKATRTRDDAERGRALAAATSRIREMGAEPLDAGNVFSKPPPAAGSSGIPAESHAVSR